MQSGDPYANIAALSLTARNLRRELEDVERDLVAMMDAYFPPERSGEEESAGDVPVVPSYQWENPPQKRN